MHGHLWTLGPFARDAVWPPRPPAARPWRAVVEDPSLGPLEIGGALAEAPGDDAIVVVHGLGGSADSGYVVRFAAAAAARGVATLRLNLRGADRRGGDFYHAGQIDDLAAAVASPALDRFARIAVVGFSLGGHVALRLAAIAPGRIAAVGAICAPLDLEAGSRHIDRPRSALYRSHLLRRLRRMYAGVAAGRPVPLPLAALRGVRTLRAWDERVVAPRYGFAGAADYYRRASVAPLLGAIAVPALYLGVEGDPMVARATVLGALAGAGPSLEVGWLRRGGHVGFPAEGAIYRAIVDALVPGVGGRDQGAAVGAAGPRPWSRPQRT